MPATAVSSNAKKAFIKTYGCQMNVYDSERMREILDTLGYGETTEMGQAELVLLNTCHIREKAAEKVFSELGRIRLIQQTRQQQGKDMLIGVAGCVAQGVGEEIFRRAPYVDMVFGPQTYHRLPEFVAAALRRRNPDAKGPGRGVLDMDFPAEYKFDSLPEPKALGPTAFVSIQEGCDKFCHYCVVPYTRGAEYSRPAADVIAEVKKFVSQGVKEITLLGQNVNGYHGEAPQGTVQEGNKDWSLGRLCYALAEIDGLARIRYTTSHPRDVDQDLVNAHRDIPQLMPYLHLPVQSGSDNILKAMNRRHKIDDYLRVIDAFRQASPQMAFSSDFIIGYPGETEEDFKATMRVIEQMNYAQAYSFKFSARPGTPAAGLTCDVPESRKDERLQIVQEKLREQQFAFNKSCIGKTLPILFEKSGRHPGQIIGGSPYLQAAYVTGDMSLLGQIADVAIEDATLNSLTGTLVS
ncbi:tRNA (N6-isopentenyl adenosine(37)-C2)-methylthiotransferase MiaB [Alphaproteobacteria bacterium]|nr:tRNA (N6-isopentenyl adenosine(37)-C2)-methylthiotransferase MiaB [Alphaproteobacteria bacterium]